jgi:transcriptional regulator GlxA family with amidase domain
LADSRRRSAGSTTIETERSPYRHEMGLVIAIPLFERVTVLDAVGPYEVLQRLPGAVVRFVGAAPGTVRADNGMLGLSVDATYEDVPTPDVIVVPGGVGTRPLLRDERVLRWLRDAHESTRFTTSVCTGALLLAAAGVLDGIDATTHWENGDELAALGARPVRQRIVERGRIITAAGVSAGIDMALLLAARLTDETTARALQLIVEYDPQPPFAMPSPDALDDDVRDRIEAIEAEKA